jgi:hypothetical protein
MKVVFNGSLKKEKYAEDAKKLRDTLEIADIEVFGVMWQVRDKDRARIQETIDAAVILNAPPETTVDWILADNSERPTTANDLRQVLLAYALRMQELFYKYRIWRSSGMNRPFTAE